VESTRQSNSSDVVYDIVMFNCTLVSDKDIKMVEGGSYHIQLSYYVIVIQAALRPNNQFFINPRCNMRCVMHMAGDLLEPFSDPQLTTWLEDEKKAFIRSNLVGHNNNNNCFINTS